MFKDVNDAVDAIRAARSLEELQALVNTPRASPVLGSDAITTEQIKQALGTVPYLSAGVLYIASGFSFVFAYFAFWIAVLCAIYWLWEIDLQGIVRSLMWVAGSFAVLALGDKVCTSLSEWFNKHQPPGWINKLC